ncbi:phosphatidylinositol/phosphatidylcholine transfer protein SFH6-like protein, partial [Tanacetum coccineum]
HAAYKLGTHVISANAIEQTIFKFCTPKIERSMRGVSLLDSQSAHFVQEYVLLKYNDCRCSGRSVSSHTNPVIELIRRLQQINTNYPDTFNQIFIINATSGFKMLWNEVQSFLEPKANCVHSKLLGRKPCYAGVPMSTIFETGMGIGDVLSLFVLLELLFSFSREASASEMSLECEVVEND